MMHRRRTLRATLGWIYVLATGVPLLLLGMWGFYHARNDWRAGQRRLKEAAVQARIEVEEQLTNHVAITLTLARELEMAGIGVSPTAERWLDAVHGRAPGFTSMLIADRNGRVLASSPDGAAGSTAADRSYFSAVAAGADWHVSNVFRGRVLGSQPIAGVSAPVRGPDGRFAGIVQGSLRLQRFAQLESRYRSVDGLRIVILDGDGNVVYGGADNRFPSLEAFPDSLRPRPGSAPASVRRDPETRRRWLVAGSASRAWGWQVLAMQPVSTALIQTRVSAAGLFLSALWSIVVIVLGLRRVLRRAILPVERLARAMQEFSITGPLRPIKITPDTPAEIVDLARTFEAMAERTQHVITGFVPICAQCKRIRDDEDQWQPVETFVRERSEAEFTHGLCPDCAVALGFAPEGSPHEHR